MSFNRSGGGHGGRRKADQDPTAMYLVLADIDKCLVFVLSVGGAGGVRGAMWILKKRQERGFPL